MLMTEMPNWLHASVIFALSAAIYMGLRIYPLWPTRYQGCDAYNILLCAETLRASKRLPIRLPPVFILEEQDQWYPPGFLVICALMPTAWLNRYYWFINQIVDLPNVGIAFVWAYAAGQPWIAAATVVVYAIQFGLIHEYANLNTRPLGTLLLTGFLCSAHLGLAEPWMTGVAAVVACLLFYSHKLSLQQLWFSLPTLAVVTADWRWLAWLPAIYLLSFVVWPRGFCRIVQGHFAIISFWNEHWPRLGAHMVRNSPIYGDGRRRAGFYAANELRGLVDFAQNVLQQNLFVIPAAGAVLLSSQLSDTERFLVGWIVSVYFGAALIHVIPQLRGIGLGRQYIKFAIVPTAILIAETAESAQSLLWVLTIGAAVLTGIQYAVAARSLRRHSGEQTGQVSDSLLAMLRLIKAESEIRLMCLPTHLCDLVAYQTRKPVYWGTHSDIFDDRLAAFFPVMRRGLEDYARDARLTHLLLDSRYASPSEFGLGPGSAVQISGHYELYSIDARNDRPAEPTPYGHADPVRD